MISIKIDNAQLKALTGNLPRKIQRCAAIALTKTAWHAKDETVRRMRTDIHRPTEFTLNALRVFPARYKSGGDLVARVEPKYDQEKYLRNIVSGMGETRRHLKRFEKSLQAGGVMPYGWVCVPAKGMTLDSHGNMGRGMIMKIISQIGVELLSGYQNRSRDKKVIARNKKRNGTFFAKQPGNKQGLPPGIYQRVAVGGGFGARNGRAWGTRMVFLFVKAAFYKPQIDFDAIGQKMVDRHFQNEFNKALAS
ncbi:hypothetical protein [uncultured Deefgea sp.]|uniref:hypothetical protein n=1 Tax=uncultured Deefgea sp. TaxID=1304914 RepID=UPI0025983A47|nr:hypothetical protein [uncultured Deefgea sp.]